MIFCTAQPLSQPRNTCNRGFSVFCVFRGSRHWLLSADRNESWNSSQQPASRADYQKGRSFHPSRFIAVPPVTMLSTILRFVHIL